MALHILGGLAKNVALKVPPEHITRPTSVMLRRRLFDAHQDMKGLCFIDVCAGAGAMGIEAWSRGATCVFLNEINRQVFKILSENVQQVEDRLVADCKERPLHLSCQDAAVFMQGLFSRELFSQDQIVLFLDPPYQSFEVYEKIFELLCRIQFKGKLWLESDMQKGFSSERLEALAQKHKGEVHKYYEQGTNYIAIIWFHF